MNIKDTIINRWENSAAGYENYIQGDLNTFKEMQWANLILCESDKNNLEILDIGTGSGLLEILSKEDHHVIGIDCSKEMIKLARINCDDCDFHVMDSHSLQFENNSFDLVISRNVTWTLYYNIIDKVYDEKEMILYSSTPLFKIVGVK